MNHETETYISSLTFQRLFMLKFERSQIIQNGQHVAQVTIQFFITAHDNKISLK